MVIDPIKRIAIDNLSNVLYDFLPASGNQNTSFPIAAQKVGLGEYWALNSKRAAIANFLEQVLCHKSHVLIAFFDEVVVQSLQWRGNRSNPLTRDEVNLLNAGIASLGYRSNFLTGNPLLDLLPKGVKLSAATQRAVSDQDAEPAIIQALSNRLIEITKFSPQSRGFEFERFLNSVFGAFGMTPSAPFRLRGEQIDGSFEHASNTYLLEAKWEADKIGQADLLTFKGKVDGKSTWSRGLFLAVNGFSEDGLSAFSMGKSTNIICMDGYDLHLILGGAVSLGKAISAKTRKAAETNRAFVSLRELT